jgi:small multidrug resistance pump
MNVLILFIGISANASASILIKMAMMPPREAPSLSDPIAMITNWPFWLGLVLYVTTFLLYVAALARMPLNVVHPVMTTGSVAAVALLSILIFHEKFYWTTTLGIFLVVLGVTLIAARLV